ncbi:MAG: DUF3788 family protein [Candidatus Kapaibacterium sp.]|jgi:hypothetical protein|nr:DUF3788 family protein [Candidatus Kapabacteria bacterium]
METINNIELRDQDKYPDEELLSTILKESFSAYKNLLRLFDKYDLNYQWRYYHDGKAWLCKVQKKKKTIVWMSAWNGFMQASIYISEKYVDKLYELNISNDLKEKFRNTKNVGKSLPCTFNIIDNEILIDFEIVMNYKLMCK